MNLLTKVAVALALLASAAFAQLLPPQGRLTLASNTPVMTSDVTGATTIYYTPYVGNNVPTLGSPGGAMVNTPMSSQLQMTIQTACGLTAGSVHDVFVTSGATGSFSSTTLPIGLGPAWASATSRGSSIPLTQVDGIWVNNYTLSVGQGCVHDFAGTTGSLTYVGSVYIDASGGVSMQFSPSPASGGSNNILGLYNAYNRVRTLSSSTDSTVDWTYNSSTWHAADSSNSNRITWLDGLQQSFMNATYHVQVNNSTNNVGYGAIGIDSTSTPNTPVAQVDNVTSATIHTAVTVNPLLGLHYAQAIESSGGGTGATYFGGQAMALQVGLEM